MTVFGFKRSVALLAVDIWGLFQIISLFNSDRNDSNFSHVGSMI